MAVFSVNEELPHADAVVDNVGAVVRAHRGIRQIHEILYAKAGWSGPPF